MSESRFDDLYSSAEEESGSSYSSANGKKSGRKGPVTKKTDNKLIVAILSLVAALAMFVVLLVIKNRVVTQEAKVSCIECIAEIPAGITLTQENMPTYFSMTERPADQVPDGRYVTSGYEVVGRTLLRKMYPRELLTLDCVSEVYFGEELYGEIEDPVLVSVDAEHIGNAVAGTLRPGDRVDVRVVIEYVDPQDKITGNLGEYDGMTITDTPEGGILEPETDPQEWNKYFEKSEADRKRLSSIFEATGFSLLVDGDFIGAYEGGVWSHSHKYKAYGVLENVYVQDVFTSAGENGEVAASNGNALTGTIVNLIIPSKYQDTLNLAMEDGSIYIAKVLTDRETSSYIDPIIEVIEEEEEGEEMVITPQPVVENRSYLVTDAEGNVHNLTITYTDGVRSSVVYDDASVEDVSIITGTYFAGDVEEDVQTLFQ